MGSYLVRVGLVYVTPEGGLARVATWIGSGNSKKGTVVTLGAVPGTVKISAAGAIDSAGIMYTDGALPYSPVLVVRAGHAWILLEDGTGAVCGDRWGYMSQVQDGRINAANQSPPGPDILSLLDQQLQQIGYAASDSDPGVDQLGLFQLQWS
jgi:hypothetical protein